MNEINFIPDSYVRGRARRRTIIRFAAVATVVLGAAAAWQWRSPRGHVAALERQRDALRTQIEAERRAIDARWQADDASRERTEFIALAARVDVALPPTFVLATVADLMPDPMTLTALSMTTVRPDRAAAASGRANEDPAGGADRAPRALAVTFEGIAPDDVSIARLIGGLDEHPLFEDVELGFSRPVDDGPFVARSFQVTAVISLDRRFLPAVEGSVSDVR